eukprot:TRINITY_DN6753_c0_g1_i1.p1 TRINITY_DN6753_c0_g1~~TRINITY_DN6753_c0_g1_i1.p1  ORF type:complete len:674 (+),score=108.50 TRINITY_DN6753_c0_g1_i1:127-2148(+)
MQQTAGTMTLDALLGLCNIKFETIKGTSRQGVVCQQLAKRAGIEADEEAVRRWEAEWECKVRAGEGPVEEVVDDKRCCKLFIGGLPNDIDKPVLKFVFSQFGDVQDVDIKKDLRNGRGRGFGFVIFKSPDAAEEAARQQTVKIRGKKVEVQLALPSGDPSLKAQRTPDPSCKIFVGGLSQETTEQHLYDYFSCFGSIVSTEVKRDHSNGRSRGFGFVTFHSIQAAIDAKDAVLPEICGKKVEVLLSMMRGDPALETTQRGPDPKRKVFVGGLPQSMREDTLKMLFEQFGEVTHAEIKRDFSNERSRGFGFVIFEDETAAEKALSRKTLYLDGKLIDIQATLKKGDPHLSSKNPGSAAPNTKPQGLENAKIFVGGLPPDATEADLTQRFSEYGEIAFTEVKTDPTTRRSRGFGFVTFKSPLSVTKALASPYPYIKGKRTDVKLPVATETSGGVPPMPNPLPEDERKIFIGGVTSDMTEAMVLAAFRQITPMNVTIELKKDPVTGKSKGYGFGVLETPGMVDLLLMYPKGAVMVGGKALEIKKASRSVPTQPINGNINTIPRQPVLDVTPTKIIAASPSYNLVQQQQPQQTTQIPSLSALGMGNGGAPTQDAFANLNQLTNINAFLNFTNFAQSDVNQQQHHQQTQATQHYQPRLEQTSFTDMYRLLPITSTGVA